MNIDLGDLRGDVMAKLRKAGQKARRVKWDEGGHTNNWRRYIDREIQAAWETLGDEARGLAYLMAGQQASDEEWD